MIPFLDLKSINIDLEPELVAAFKRVLLSGTFILGREVEAFENELAEYCEVEHAIGVGNGLDALILILKALGLGPGDEVLVPSNTYIATWLAVTHVGATPVPVEPSPKTSNMDPSRLDAALTPRVRAVMPVHLYGQPADLDAILDFAAKNRLFVVEDAAQAHGAKYKGRRIGGHGHAAGWSFYPGKNLGGLGDGGAITTNSKDLANKLRILRNYGSEIKYHNQVIGWNSRLDELQAAFLRIKLLKLDAGNSNRKNIAEYYNQKLSAFPGLTLPYVLPIAEPVWHIYAIRHFLRDGLVRFLTERHISSLIHYPIPPHLQPAYASLGMPRGSLPIAESLADEVLSLPISQSMTLDQAEIVVDAIRDFMVAIDAKS